MAERIPVAFLAGMASVIFPCVLPLVPGYISTVTAASTAVTVEMLSLIHI